MSYFQEITTAVRSLSQWQRAAVATSCAESVSAVISVLAVPETKHQFENALELAWASLSKRTIVSDVVSARSSLDELPESSADNSHLSSFNVMISLSVIAYALDSIIEEDSEAAARDACVAATSIYGDCDAVLNLGEHQAETAVLRVPSPATLESLQIQLQKRMIGNVGGTENSHANNTVILEEMRSLARQLSSKFSDSVRAYAERRCWK